MPSRSGHLQSTNLQQRSYRPWSNVCGSRECIHALSSKADGLLSDVVLLYRDVAIRYILRSFLTGGTIDLEIVPATNNAIRNGLDNVATRYIERMLVAVSMHWR